MKKRLWPGPALFLLFWLTLLAGGSSRFLRDPGQFWHTVCGEKILSEGFFDHDPFTFTRAGEPWIPHQWLGEVTMAAIHRIAGFDSLLVAAAALLAGIFADFAARLIRQGLHPIFAVGVALLAIAAASAHFHLRPHLFTMLGMAVTMRFVLNFERGTIGLRQLTWLVPFFLLWSNTHGGMLGGLTTLGLAFIGWLICHGLRLTSPIPAARTLIGLAAIGICCGLTAFVTPYGERIFETWLFINNSMPRLPEIIVEHARLDPADSRAWLLMAFAGLYLAMLAGTLPNRPKVAWLIPFFWMIQAGLRVRHGSLFAIVGMVALVDIWPHTRYAKWLALKRPDVYESKPNAESPTWSIAITALVCVLMAFGLQLANVPVPLVGRGCANLDPELWPLEALPELKNREPVSPGSPKKIFCEYIYGGFLEYHAPGYRVFVDDRCELFGDAWLVDFVNAENDGTADAMERWQREFGEFDFALTATPSAYGDYFEQRPETWVMVTKTDRVRFFVHR